MYLANDIYKRISRAMFSVNKLFAKILIMLHDENNTGFTDTAKTQSNEDVYHYLSLSYFAMVILEINDKNISWDRKARIIMTQKNQYQIISGIKKAIDTIYKEGMYYYDNGTLCLSKITENDIVRIYNAGDSNKIVIVPNIVSDADTNQYEGVRIFVNDSTNSVDLTIDELETLYYNLSKIDLFLYSQGLINFYVSYLEKGVIIEQAKDGKKSKSLFTVNPDIEKQSTVKVIGSTLKKDDDPFLGLK